MVDILRGNDFFITQLKNRPIPSNCYIIIRGNCAVIVDPGSPDISEIELLLFTYQVRPKFIILTHEHFDHSSGVNLIRKKYSDIKLVCTDACNKAIADVRYNLSCYYEKYASYVIKHSEIEIEKCKIINLMGLGFEFVPTQGHSIGGMTIFLDTFVFTGDLIIPKTRVITTLKGGNKFLAKKSCQLVFQKCTNDSIILPGHGNINNYKDIL